MYFFFHIGASIKYHQKNALKGALLANELGRYFQGEEWSAYGLIKVFDPVKFGYYAGKMSKWNYFYIVNCKQCSCKMIFLRCLS